MDDYKILIYILLAAGSYLITNWRKFFKDVDGPSQPKKFRDPNAGPINRPQPQQQNPTAPATSFEDILRELQPKVEKAKEQGKEIYEKAREPLRPEPVVVAKSYDNKTYEKPKAAPISLEDPAYKREAARRRQEFKPLVIPKLQPQAQSPVPNYAKLLRTPAGAREAFVLSEILNRKHF
ncbi:hypothetical protein [Pontibacter harenae]|uniref:hypothetical protein n=1 Tax=Pontibacter harenae TaxID=2894083 RepID=UPI001E46DD2A|nr:hypothetical protein [Pontibacter harenae]MCC9168308.1 hypothetical protein [Pontibacter harenae]